MSNLSKKMQVVKGSDPGRDPSGFIRVELKCPTCKRSKFVRRADVSTRNVCRFCEADARMEAGKRVRGKRRENKNQSADGNTLGGLNRYKPVFLYLDADSAKSARLILSNKGTRRAPHGCSMWTWAFVDGVIPLQVLDCYGRELTGDTFSLLGQIDATIKLLKGE